jgi:hypothetical protein
MRGLAAYRQSTGSYPNLKTSSFVPESPHVLVRCLSDSPSLGNRS